MPKTRNQRYRLQLLKDQQLTLQYNFARDKTLAASNSRGPTLTLTRATEGRYYDADGIIQTAASGAARFDHNPSTGESLGLLIEEARTNIGLRSETWDQWGNSASVDAQAQGTAPDGQNTANKLTDDSGGGTGEVVMFLSTTIAVDSVFTYSCYLKKDQLDWAQLGIGNLASLVITAFFDLTNGVVGTVSGDATSAAIEDVGNGWFRCSLVFTSDSADSSGILKVVTADANDDAVCARDGTSSIFMWGSQLELGAFPTTYIPTTTVSVTRNKDVVQTTDVSWLDESQGTFYAEGQAGGSADFSGMFSISDETTTDEIYVTNQSARMQTYSRKTSGTNGDISTGIGNWAVNTLKHISIAYATNDFAASLGGGAVASDATITPPTGMTHLKIGCRANSTNQWGGHIRQFRYYNQRMNNQFLEDLSADRINAQ